MSNKDLLLLSLQSIIICNLIYLGVEEDESNYRNDTGHQHPEIISSIKKMTGRKKHSEAKSTVPDFYNFCEQQFIKKSYFFRPY